MNNIEEARAKTEKLIDRIMKEHPRDKKWERIIDELQFRLAQLEIIAELA